MKKISIFLVGFTALAMSSNAQHKLMDKDFGHANGPVQKIYLSTGMDGYVLSTAMVKKGGQDAKLTTPRFTAFFHFGVNANFDFNNNIGIYSGLGIKNIGFIEKFPHVDSTVIRRTYTIGIPLGLKIGNMNKGNYVMFGGGIDIPFHYKEKGFVKRSKKEKFSEWFSQRTQPIMPYVFVGANLNPGVSFKLQYYPTNFLNADYETMANGMNVKPYGDYEVNLMMITMGFNINYRPKTFHQID